MTSRQGDPMDSKLYTTTVQHNDTDYNNDVGPCDDNNTSFIYVAA